MTAILGPVRWWQRLMKWIDEIDRWTQERDQ